jgi:hypothetical protein
VRTVSADVGIFNSTCVDAPPPYLGFRGCFFVKATSYLWVNYIVDIVLQGGVCC